MEDIFKPQSLTIKELFGNSDSLYQIPRYQRPYTWGNEQLEKLWEDLTDAMANEPNYFLGSVITAKPESSSNYLDIVDGQQRLTTLLILLCVYRDLYPNINADILDQDPFAIDANIIKSSIRFNDRFERLRLKTHSNHESDFQQFILQSGSTLNNDFPYKKDLRKSEEPKFKFLNTSAFFAEKLEELGTQEAGQFINYLFNSVKIIRIDCRSVSFAIKLFQVLNDRGLDLTPADLIKSYLLGEIHKKYQQDDELKKQHENRFMDDWKHCENIAIDTGESMNNLLVMYEYYLLETNPEKSLYDELTRQFAGKDSNDIAADFKRFCSSYKSELFGSEDVVIFGLWYIRWTMYWKSIALTAIHTNYPETQNFLVLFRRYYYLNWIAGHTLTRIKQTSFNLIKLIKERKPLSEIESLMNNHLETNGTLNRAIDNLSGEIYFEPWCKPLFFMIEYNQLDHPSFYDNADGHIHLDHIIPRAYEKNEDWRSAVEIEYLDQWIHSGANLTLLSGAKNLAASNHSFSKKLIAYDGTGHHMKEDQKVSSFKITQNIVNQSRAAGNWDISQINDRWQWFCSEVERLLEIDLSELKLERLESSSYEELINDINTDITIQ